MKSPAFQWYPTDYLGSQRVAMMTLEEEGAYCRLLWFCWQHGTVPSDPVLAARLIGKGCSVETAKVALEMFESSGQPGRLVHDRLEFERKKQEAWRQKSKKGGLQSARVKALSKGGSRVVEKCLEPNVNSPVFSLQSPSPTPVPEHNTVQGSPCDRTQMLSNDERQGASPPETPAPSKRFEIPSIETVKLIAAKTGLPPVEAERFFHYYESNGWKVGKNPMRSLPAAVSSWKLRWESNGSPGSVAAPVRKDYSDQGDVF